MARFAITYEETYARTYYVEADTYLKACNKLEDAIMNDKVDAPDICVNGVYKNVTEYHVESLKNDDYLDVK